MQEVRSNLLAQTVRAVVDNYQEFVHLMCQEPIKAETKKTPVNDERDL